MENWQQIIAELNSAQSVIISTHVSPDADAIGSSGALCRILSAAGKEAVVHLEEPLPKRFVPLTTGVDYIHEPPFGNYDVAVILDTASRSRVGRYVDQFLESARITINIDHHASNPAWADLNFIDSGAAATAVIVQRLARDAAFPIFPDAATLLYAGVLEDTGCFRFSNTDQESFSAAATLVASGADPVSVADVLYFSVPERVMRLRARALAELKIILDGKAAIIAITKAIMDECEASTDDCEGLVDIARSVEGVKVALFFRETEKGWKVSFRSKSEAIDVDSIASRFGGGGHRAAAGASIEERGRGAIDKVVSALEEALAA